MRVENCGAKQTREKEVNQELNNAEETCNRLVTRLDELEERLHSVLHEATPTSVEAEEQVTIVPLAHRIRNHFEILQHLGTRIGSILDRLEIR